MKKFLALLVIFCFTFSCIPDTGTDGNLGPESGTAIEDIIIFETKSAAYPFIFQHISGEQITVLDDDGNGIYNSVLYKNGSYEELVEFDEVTGLPSSKIANNGTVVNYSYKENFSLMDLAVKTLDDTYFMRNVSLNDILIEKASKLNGITGRVQQDELTQRMRYLVDAIGIAGDIGLCLTAVSAYTAGTAISVGGLTLPGLLIPLGGCAPLAINLTNAVRKATDNQLLNSLANELDLAGTYADLLDCPFDINGCLEILINEMLDSRDRLNLLRQRLKQELEKLKKDLEESAEIVIIGDLNFGEVEIGEMKTEIIDIYNRGTEPITVNSIIVNSNGDQFIVNTPFPIALGPEGSETFKTEISVTFKPKDVADTYNTFLKIENDKYEPFDAKTITATATNEDGAKIRFDGTLNFNGVTLDKPHSEFFDIINPNLNDDLIVTSITFEGEPAETFEDKFSINGWKSGTIKPGEKQEVEVVFRPTDVVEYDGLIIVKNNLDDDNNKWPLFGKGKNLEIRLVGDLDFGQVNVGDTRTLSLDIENPNLNDPITVTDIEVLEGFSVDWKAGSIPPLSKKTVNVTFTPLEEKEYTSLLIVVNDADQENNRVTLKGNQDEENYLSGIWKLQLTDSSTNRIILNELITFNTEEDEINTELANGGTYIENSYQFNGGLDINLIVENNIADACEDGSPPFQSTQIVTLNINTKWVYPLLYYRKGEYFLVINMSPNVPCPENYRNSVGTAVLVRQ